MTRHCACLMFLIITFEVDCRREYPTTEEAVTQKKQQMLAASHSTVMTFQRDWMKREVIQGRDQLHILSKFNELIATNTKPFWVSSSCWKNTTSTRHSISHSDCILYPTLCGMLVNPGVYTALWYTPAYNAQPSHNIIEITHRVSH